MYRTLALLAAVLLVALPAQAGSADDPEITDPSGDAQHIEFQNQEPALDVTKVWFGWDNGTLMVTIEVPGLAVLDPTATEDPVDEAIYFDVYWTFNGTDHVARAWFDGTEHYEAGQTMRIERILLWEIDDDIHGSLLPQQGHVDMTNGSQIHILVDPAAVGGPTPGDVLEAPAFSTYVDHHTGDELNHHPGHVDESGGPGRAFTVPGLGPASNNTTDDPAGADGRDTPGVGLVAIAATLGALAVVRRRP